MAKVKGDGNISSRRLFYFIKVQQKLSCSQVQEFSGSKKVSASNIAL